MVISSCCCGMPQLGSVIGDYFHRDKPATVFPVRVHECRDGGLVVVVAVRHLRAVVDPLLYFPVPHGGTGAGEERSEATNIVGAVATANDFYVLDSGKGRGVKPRGQEQDSFSGGHCYLLNVAACRNFDVMQRRKDPLSHVYYTIQCYGCQAIFIRSTHPSTIVDCPPCPAFRVRWTLVGRLVGWSVVWLVGRSVGRTVALVIARDSVIASE